MLRLFDFVILLMSDVTLVSFFFRNFFLLILILVMVIVFVRQYRTIIVAQTVFDAYGVGSTWKTVVEEVTVWKPVSVLSTDVTWG